MKSRLLLLLLAAHAGTALAQYKCTAASGAVTFQERPCVAGQAEQKLVVIPNGHPPPASGVLPAPVSVPQAASGPAASVDKRMLANYERQRRRDALQQALQAAQDEKAGRAAQRLDAIAGARAQFGDDPASAQALSDALAAIDSRYRALGALDDLHVASAQAALDEWEKTQATQPAP